MKQKGFAQIILVLVLVVVAIGVVVYFGTLKNKTGLVSIVPTPTPVVSDQPVVNPTVKPTSDPTASWKTYTNEKYFFQLKYPSIYAETLNSEENDIWLDYPGPPSAPLIVVNITINPSKPNDTLSSYVEDSTKQFRDLNLNFKTDELRLGQEKAIKLSYQKDGGIQEEIFAIHANYRYLINRISESEKLGRSEEFDQILSTFKFTK